MIDDSIFDVECLSDDQIFANINALQSTSERDKTWGSNQKQGETRSEST